MDEELNLWRLNDTTSDWFLIPNFLPKEKIEGQFKNLVKDLKWSKYKQRLQCCIQLNEVTPNFHDDIFRVSNTRPPPCTQLNEIRVRICSESESPKDPYDLGNICLRCLNFFFQRS